MTNGRHLMCTYRGTLAVMLAAAGAATAQQDPSAAVQTARMEWRAGNYISALERLESVLAGPAARAVLPAVAELTGEWYRVDEVSPDGRRPRWSGDGVHFAFEIGEADSVETRVVAVRDDGPEVVTTVRGHGLAFAGTATPAAFLRLDAGPGLDEARADVRRRMPVRDRASFDAYMEAVRRTEAGFTDIYTLPLDRPVPQRVPVEGWGVVEVVPHPNGEALYAVAFRDRDAGPSRLVRISLPDGGVQLIGTAEHPRQLQLVSDGGALVYQAGQDVAIVDLDTGKTTEIQGRDLSVSRDGRWLALVVQSGDTNGIAVVGIGDPTPTVVARTVDRVANPTVGSGGTRVAYQQMTREDWEIWLAGPDQPPTRLTYDVQHDLFPVFLSDRRLLVIKGEGRHRRSYIYDLPSGQPTRLFHNNTVRTVAPEYEWVVHPDATSILIVSERDGDTISPERGLYLTRLEETVSLETVRVRVQRNLAAERDLRDRGIRMFAPIHEAVADLVANVAVERIYEYERDLFVFGSKFITRPGNRLAIEYLTRQLRAFGYEPELQWFEPRPGLRSANVIATLRGTRSSELTYVISSHFDSVERGPGADDNTSGTAALLEVARVMAEAPMPATIRFAFFTGEEAGLLGSREFVRRAVEREERIVGALNNDMVGYANDERMDNTIRYSNSGIRDLQHAAAMLFTDLITYDAKYYKSTDAHAYYEAYGDIVGGIGSYPILANPHYHQAHDVLETIDHQLVAEVAKTTAASIMLLASSPSRIADLTVDGRVGNAIRLRWSPAPETGPMQYVVAYGPSDDPFRHRVTTSEPTITLDAGIDAARVAVKARNAHGFESWDWAHLVLGDAGGGEG